MENKELKILLNDLIKDFEVNNLTEFELELPDFKVKMKKMFNLNGKVNEDKKVKSLDDSEKNIFEVKAPLIGTYYSSSSPKQASFVNENEQVKEGQTICIIESMKIMNEITSPVDGRVISISKKDNDIVGFGELLFKIEV